MKQISSKLSDFPWVFPLILFVVLMVLGATAHPLWGDEAETAFFARTILQTGLPKGFDGVNVSSVDDAIVLNEDLINHRSPWGQYYLTAASFALFGESTFAARLPFVILGGFALIVIYYLALKISADKRVAVVAVVLSSVSVPLILYSFQDRYYSLVIFSGLLQMLMSFSLLEPVNSKRNIRKKVIFVIAGIIFAYSNYAIFIIFSLSLFFAHVMTIGFVKKLRPVFWRFTGQYILFSGISLLFFLPWFWIMKPGDDGGEGLSFSLMVITEALPVWLKLVFSYFNASVFPNILWLCLFLLIGVKLFRKEEVRPLLFVSSLILLYFLFFALFDSSTAVVRTVPINPLEHAVVISNKFAEVRYHIITIPLFLILVSLILGELKRVHGLLFYSALVLYIGTNFIIFPQPRSLLAEYVMEVTDPYPVADEAVARFLKDKAADGETAFVNSDRAHESLQFLLGEKKIKFVNRISPTNPRVFPKNYNVLPKYLYSFRQDPDWVIKYSSHKPNSRFLDFDMREFSPIGRADPLNLEEDYELTVLPIFYGSDIARPEIELHQFKKIEPKEDERVFIYRKKS